MPPVSLMAAHEHLDPRISAHVDALAGEREVVLRLRLACEAHDPTIHDHLENVTRYAVALARAAGLTDREIEFIRLSTPLHDLGKIATPRAILEKPGRLNDEEMKIVQQHTVIGYDILAGGQTPLLICAANIARHHHENWDGSGYPDGLAGEDIPVEARIVAIADVFDALLSARVYKPAWSTAQVIDELTGLRGRKFDPALLDIFLSHISWPEPASTKTAAAS